MAGIGFELKRLFRKQGIFARVRAYGYAGAICAGPMMLGVILILGLMLLCGLTHTPRADKELLVCMITYTLLASLLITSFFSMPLTRFLADMLYENKTEMIMPSFWGSSAVMMSVGCVLYGVFLLFSGVALTNRFLLFVVFEELIVVWNAMNYLTAIKDYKGILKTYASAVVVTFLSGYVLIMMGIPHVQALLTAAAAGYGWMMNWDIILLHQCFQQKGNWKMNFRFLHWIDEFLPLALTGLFLNLGMFSHLVIMWSSPQGVNVGGAFFGAPSYDVPAFLAFLTTLITTINFVVYVEVNFYPKYRTYYGLFNNKGSVRDIQRAEKAMLTILDTELKYTALQQLIVTAVSIAVISGIMQYLPLGFNDLMYGYFRTLCVGYGIYAVGNTILLFLLYFTDYEGAMISSAVFAATNIIFTVFSLFFDEVYIGFGFILSCAAFFVIAYLRLNAFTGKLLYHILSVQPIVEEEKAGIFTKMEKFLEERGQFSNEK